MLPPRLALLDGLFGSQRALRKDLVPLVEPGLDGVDVVVQVDAQRRELGNDGGRLVLRRLAVRLDDVRRGDAAAQLLREQLGDLGLVELEVDLPDDGAEVGGAEALEQDLVDCFLGDGAYCIGWRAPSRNVFCGPDGKRYDLRRGRSQEFLDVQRAARRTRAAGGRASSGFVS